MGSGSRRVVGHEYFGLLSPRGNVVRRVFWLAGESLEREGHSRSNSFSRVAFVVFNSQLLMKEDMSLLRASVIIQYISLVGHTLSQNTICTIGT